MSAKEWAETRFYADISRDARAFLEGACNVRYFEKQQQLKDGDPSSKTYGQVLNTWVHVEYVRVKPLGREYGGSGIAEYVIDPCYKADDLAWLKQRGMDPIDVQRPPRSGDWHGLLPGEIAEGQRRVIVNLDTLEYIDPVRFGQVPTLAGMVQMAPKQREIEIIEKAHQEWANRIHPVSTAGRTIAAAGSVRGRRLFLQR